jgi:hypothetical protein
MIKKVLVLLAIYAQVPIWAMPNSPTNLHFSDVTKSSVSLGWNDNSDDESGFKVFRNGDLIGITSSDQRTFIDRGLEASTTYDYVVKATDDSTDYNRVANVNNWYVYSNSQNNALTKLYDNTLKKDVISLKTSNGKSIGMQLGSEWDDDSSIITWEQNVKGHYVVYTKIKTTKGDRYITYIANANDSSLHDGSYLEIGFIPPKDSSWRSVTRDIGEDLKRVEGDNEFISVDAVFIRIFDEGKFGSITLSKSNKKDALDISFVKKTSGIDLKSISHLNSEFLNQNNQPSLFSAIIKNSAGESKTILADTGWGSVAVEDGATKKRIILKNPTDNFFPSTLVATITVDIADKKSAWDLLIDGVGNSHTLMYVTFPTINIKSNNNGKFFTPWKYGQITDASSLHYGAHLNKEYGLMSGDAPDGLYPMGWRATMAYMAYYDKNYGLYFGFHDKKASIKNFLANSADNGVEVSCDTPVPNMTKMGNSFDFPGVFEMDLFSGDWFDASLIYKDWVFKYANFRPIDTEDRLARAKEIGKISAWFENNIHEDLNEKTESDYVTIKEFFKSENSDPTIWTHFTAWSGEAFDQNMPDTFLNVEDGVEDLVTYWKGRYDDSLMVDLYTNAYLYDTTLPTFSTFKDHATKRENGDYYKQYYGRWFAIMCPTQKAWQDKHLEINRFIKSLGVDGVYLDQVSASSPVMCFDLDHGHSLGGGSYWADGYREFIKKVHSVYDREKFVITENFNDSLADEVDGFMCMYYTAQNQVPAAQSVYGGKVQFFGPAIKATSHYENLEDAESLYATLAQGLAFGNVLGSFYPSIVLSREHTGDISIRAANYTKSLVTMRDKLKNYMSYGSIQKPLTISGNIPTIDVPKSGDHTPFTMSAIQTGIWKDSDGNVAILFINGNKPDLNAPDIKFSFDFDGSKYGLSGDLKIKEVRAYNETSLGTVNNSFTKDITLPSASVVAYIISK